MELNKKQMDSLANQTALDASEIDLDDFLILTDAEADEKTREYIEESLWAFDIHFIDAHSDLNPNALNALCKAKIELCEDSNDLVKAIIKDFDYFVVDAIRVDGRGHFLSCYDGNEIELPGNLFAYRTN